MQPPTPLNGLAIDLDTIDPLAFEELIRQLLERMGFQATLTKASGDGGVDIEAFNPQPITGGRIIVQCKRYAHVVGSPFVRDLYGAVVHARASKGILITTSRFSSDAVTFAHDKPLELIDRQQLEDLLRRFGFQLWSPNANLPSVANNHPRALNAGMISALSQPAVIASNVAYPPPVAATPRGRKSSNSVSK